MKLKNIKIAIIGLGYVGLPLAVEFGKKYSVLGFDINQSRIDELNLNIDRTNEVDIYSMKFVMDLAKSNQNTGLTFTSSVDLLKNYLYNLEV